MFLDPGANLGVPMVAETLTYDGAAPTPGDGLSLVGYVRGREDESSALPGSFSRRSAVSAAPANVTGSQGDRCLELSGRHGRMSSEAANRRRRARVACRSRKFAGCGDEAALVPLRIPLTTWPPGIARVNQKEIAMSLQLEEHTIGGGSGVTVQVHGDVDSSNASELRERLRVAAHPGYGPHRPPGGAVHRLGGPRRRHLRHPSGSDDRRKGCPLCRCRQRRGAPPIGHGLRPGCPDRELARRRLRSHQNRRARPRREGRRLAPSLTS